MGDNTFRKFVFGPNIAIENRIINTHHKPIKTSPSSNCIGISKPIPAGKKFNPFIGKSNLTPFSVLELKTTYAPKGNERIIKPKITETNAENGIPKDFINLFCSTNSFLVKFY
jgi:hypothetical protein